MPNPPWQGYAALPASPEHRVHKGRYVVLEPLAAEHLDDLWAAAQGADTSWAHLRFGPFSSKAALAQTLAELMARQGQPFWAVRPKGCDAVLGWLSYCDIYQADQAIEIGQIWFSPALQRTRAATEAIYLLMDHAFSALGYRRLVWRCSANNIASLRAAERFGFRPEGRWRGGVFIKGEVRDVVWHAILHEEWPSRRTAFEAWLDPANFSLTGLALSRLGRAV
jgi:RimJ/RimL family protein N-acetyltransferase